MTIFERLRMLAAPEGDAGGGATPPEGGDKGAGGDAAAKAAADKAAADAAAASGKKDGEGDRKSVLDGDKKDGKGDASGKDGEAKAKDAAASDYVVKLPEGMKEADVDKAQLDAFTKFAKEKGLTPDQASQALGYWKNLQDAQAKEWAAKDQAWYGALEKDAEFGGANLKASELALQTALKRFDTDGSLAKDLATYGIENLPSLAKFLARVGKAGGEDKPRVDTAPKDTGKKLTSTERHKVLYTDMGDGQAKTT